MRVGVERIPFDGPTVFGGSSIEFVLLIQKRTEIDVALPKTGIELYGLTVLPGGAIDVVFCR